MHVVSCADGARLLDFESHDMLDIANPTFETLFRYAAAIGPVESMRDFAPA